MTIKYMAENPAMFIWDRPPFFLGLDNWETIKHDEIKILELMTPALRAEM